MGRKIFCGFLGILVICGVTWLFWDITTPTFNCREVNQTPVQIFGSHGTVKGAVLGILEKKFWFRVDITNLPLDWQKYKSLHGSEEYVHAHNSGGATVLTDNPYHIWKFFGGYYRKWSRVIWPPPARK